MGKQISHLPEGTLLSGRYKIVKFIGSGGFGCTYLADHLLFGTKVAIKEFFVNSLCNRDNTGVVSIGTESQTMIVEKLSNKFLREARSLNKLSHPNIVRVSDVFQENGTNYYVMDYIEGRSLHAAISVDGPLSETHMMHYMGQIMNALEYLHGRGMLHLDIKPDNIMVDANDKAILIDFGVAKQYGDGAHDSTSTVLGQTPGFAPLEQMSNNVKAFSAATDIYALGATMYALLTGITPPTAPELASGVAELPELPPYVTENMRRTLASMMEIKHSERLQSIAEVRAMLSGQPLPTKGKHIPTAPILGSDPNIPPQSKGSAAMTPPPNPPAKTIPQLPGLNSGVASRQMDKDTSGGKKTGLIIGIIAAAATLLIGVGVFIFMNFVGNDKDEIAGISDSQIDLTDQPDNEDSNAQVEDPIASPLPGNATVNTSAQQPGREPEPNRTNTQTPTQSESAINTAAPSETTGSGQSTSAGTSNSSANTPAAAPVRVTAGTPGQNGHQYVDMGTGAYWATCNLGASSPHDSGSYFAWGEVSPKSSFTASNYALAGTSFTNISGTQYDAATHMWGINWSIPSNQDWNKLLANCYWEAQDGGVLLRSKINDNTLFLPNAGYMSNSSKRLVSYYWSGQSNGESATIIAISDGKGKTLSNRTNGNGALYGYYGLPIRPVYKP